MVLEETQFEFITGVMIHSPLLSLQTHSYLIKEEPCPFSMQPQVYGKLFSQAFMICGHLPRCAGKRKKNPGFQKVARTSDESWFLSIPFSHHGHCSLQILDNRKCLGQNLSQLKSSWYHRNTCGYLLILGINGRNQLISLLFY